MKIAIVLPVFNRKDITLRCLDSLYSVPDDKYLIIVVDSGSTDGTREAVRKNYSEVTLLETTPESWWAAATNIGIKEAVKAGCKYILTYNDDNVATTETLNRLVETAEQYPCSIISSVKCSYQNPDVVLFAGRRRARFTDRSYFMNRGQTYDQIGTGTRKVDWLHGQCTLFPATVFEAVGLFDENSFPHLYADDDLILRAKQAGYDLLVNLDAVVLNDEKQTGINPYYSRIPLRKIPELFTSRKSFFQLATKTRFLWRHKRNIFTFVITWIADYTRLFIVILLRWILPERIYKNIEKYYLKIVST
jgi:GT2 family glycosyltransferase